MSGDLDTVMGIAASGLQTQGQRMRVIAQNMANANTTADAPGADPYRRQVVTFRQVFDKEMNANKVTVSGVKPDMSDFTRRFDPSHPAADKDGYVLLPNVKPLVEVMDMRDAQRSYEANLNVIEASRGMMLRTIDLLRN
ncbi:MAG: flagellar basal body rod protein FlgC [Alphaproteobacteria bacterium]|nr:flagellar basal body rod protein FlgC [Alphaproteobacteria bacterium]